MLLKIIIIYDNKKERFCVDNFVSINPEIRENAGPKDNSIL